MDDRTLIQELQGDDRAALRRAMEVYAGYAAAGGRILVGVHIVGSHDALALDVVHIAHVGGHVKGHDVACVVAVQVQDACAGLHFLGDIVDLLRGRGLEDAAYAAAVDQAVAHIAQEQRQMAGATARDDGYLAGLLLLPAVAAQVVVYIFHLVAVGGIDAFEHFVYVIFRCIDNLLHKCSSSL